MPIGIFVAFFVSHLAIRKLAPEADPAILPIVFALSGIGIAFVTRLAPDLAVRQLMWLVLGIVCMLAVLILVRNLDKLANYKYTLIILGVLLLLSPLLPVVGQEIYGSRIWLSLGPFSFQPGELAKICIVLFLAAYLAQNREMLSVFTWDVGPLRLPSLPHAHPASGHVGARVRHRRVREGPRQRARAVPRVPGHALRRDGQKALRRRRRRTRGSRRHRAVDVLRARPATRRHLARPLRRPHQHRLSAGADALLARRRRLFGVGIGQGMSDAIPVVESDFIFTAIAEERRACSAPQACSFSTYASLSAASSPPPVRNPTSARSSRQASPPSSCCRRSSSSAA